jgi:hypothetical protein
MYFVLTFRNCGFIQMNFDWSSWTSLCLVMKSCQRWLQPCPAIRVVHVRAYIQCQYILFRELINATNNRGIPCLQLNTERTRVDRTRKIQYPYYPILSTPPEIGWVKGMRRSGWGDENRKRSKITEQRKDLTSGIDGLPFAARFLVARRILARPTPSYYCQQRVTGLSLWHAPPPLPQIQTTSRRHTQWTN